MIESAKKEATKAVTDAVMEAIPGMLNAAMPEIPEVPSATGGVVPF